MELKFGKKGEEMTIFSMQRANDSAAGTVCSDPVELIFTTKAKKFDEVTNNAVFPTSPPKELPSCGT